MTNNEITFFKQGVERLSNIFNKPSPEEIRGKLYTKVKKTKKGHIALVKKYFFQKWKPLGWWFFDEQPGRGYTQMKATTKKHGRSYYARYDDAYNLIWDFKRHRGAGITIA